MKIGQFISFDEWKEDLLLVFVLKKIDSSSF